MLDRRRATRETLVGFVRHGTHDEVGRILSGRSEIGPNDTGRAQARRLADGLAQTPIAAIHSSPRRRASETAAILAAPHGIEVDIVPALDEIDFGDWSGRSFATLEADRSWRLWNGSRGRAVTPGGDTMVAAVARARQHLDAIAADEPVLCVSHGDVIRGVAASCLGLDLDDVLDLGCEPASVTIIAVAAGRTRLVSLNECAA